MLGRVELEKPAGPVHTALVESVPGEENDPGPELLCRIGCPEGINKRPGQPHPCPKGRL